MSIAIAKSYVEVPAPVVRTGGILSVANVLPTSGHALLGAEYLTDACAPGGTWTDLCYVLDQQFCSTTPPTPPVDGYKEFGQPDLVEGSPFVVYDGVDCNRPGETPNDARARARLEFSEGRQVDHYFETWLSANEDSSIGAVSLTEAIMAFEDIGSEMYGSYPVIVMPRSMAVCAAMQELIFRSAGGGLETINGTEVAAISPSTPGATTADIWVTGRISLIRGPVETHAVGPVTRPDGTCDPARALAERIYVPLIECMIVGATASCETTIPAT